MARDAEAVAALFEADASYLDASELDPWLGGAAIGRRVAVRCAEAVEIVIRITAPQARQLATDVVSVFAIVDRGAAVPGRPMSALRLRVTLIARRAADGWKISHYAEASKAPLLELEAFYEAVAADGLDAIPRRVG